MDGLTESSWPQEVLDPFCGAWITPELVERKASVRPMV